MEFIGSRQAVNRIHQVRWGTQ